MAGWILRASTLPSENTPRALPPDRVRVEAAEVYFYLRTCGGFWYDFAVVGQNKNSPLLSEENAVFMQRNTSMNVAGRDKHNRPALARGLGCRVSADRCRVTVFLSETHSTQVLQCLRQNGVIAMAITRPATHETLQLKGTVLEITTLTDDDRENQQAYAASFIDELALLGYRAEFTQTMLAGSDASVAVVFELTELFNQTPGPKAGQKLASQK